MKISGISGQTTQQNHSIWAFQNSKYIGLFDVDEYINMQNDNNINSFFQKLIQDEKINTKEIGSFRLLNKFFYNSNNLPTNNYEFLKIYNCDDITLYGHEKNFVLPKNVSTFSVHMITNGKKMHTIDNNKLYFNHYYFLNKESKGKWYNNSDDLTKSKLKRGLKKTNFIDDSIKKHCFFIKN